MFSDLLEGIDALEEEERKSACLWVLEQCASTVEELSRELERQRRQLLAALAGEGKGQVDTQVPMSRSLRQCLEEFEVTEDTNRLAESLANFVSPDRRGKGQIRDLCRIHESTVMPVSRKRRAVLELANQLTFRLYGVSALEAEQVRNELKAWSP